jgi:phosphatidylserine/phosphatidylglycerophosphate/cardiolipin synthase-like enzyme
MTWNRYYEACNALPLAVAKVEEALGSSVGRCVTVTEVLRLVTGYGLTYDAVGEVLAALAELGAVSRVSDGAYEVTRTAFEGTRSSRMASLDALDWARQAGSQSCEVLLASAADYPEFSGGQSNRPFLELRTSVRSLIAEATTSLILAAPYWDTEVAEDLGGLVERRLSAGVRVTILARAARPGTSSAEALALLSAIGRQYSSFDIRILEQPSINDPFGSSTFHFKAACADDERVYIGSANFNTAGMASRWELGVLLKGVQAGSVARLLNMLVSASRVYMEVGA